MGAYGFPFMFAWNRPPLQNMRNFAPWNKAPL